MGGAARWRFRSGGLQFSAEIRHLTIPSHVGVCIAIDAVGFPCGGAPQFPDQPPPSSQKCDMAQASHKATILIESGSRGTTVVSAVRAALLRKRGTPQWDGVLRATGIVALLALYPCWRWPEVAGMVGFLGVTIFVNGPLSPVLPAAYEPVLMATGRVYPPLLVALVGIAGTLYVEFLNYHLYRAAVTHPRFELARRSALVSRTVALFERSPFFCVWLCAWSPLPYWTVRFLAPMTRYPVAPYLLATFLGRMPRLFFFAAIGLVVPLSTQVLGMITVTMVVTGITIAVHRGMRHRELPSAPARLAVPHASVSRMTERFQLTRSTLP